MSSPPRVIDSVALLRQLWGHLSARRHRQFFVLVVCMLAGAMGEVLSLGAVLPFLGVLVAPDRVYANPTVHRWASAAGIDSAAELVLPLTVVFVAVALAAAIVRLFVLWATTRYSFAVGIDLGVEMYHRTLHQPYQVHVARNSSEIITSLTAKTSTVVMGVILMALGLISSTIVLAAIVVMFLWIDPATAIWAAAGFAVSYAIVTFIFRKRLAEDSAQLARGQSELFKTLQEGLGGIRDVILDGTQDVYTVAYHRADRAVRMAQSRLNFIAASPRFAMEGLGMSLMALVAYFAIARTGELGVALPVLGALALGAQRLIPAFQQAYASWTTIVGSQESLRDVLQLLDQRVPAEARLPAPEPLQFRDAIELSNVRFRYAADGPWVLDGLNLTIPRGSRVGIIGSTGSGKSTVVDLIMGLLEPTDGAVMVDGQTIAGTRRRAWQRTVAHVPQTVFLADATLAANIALGVTPAAIDMERVRLAARQAQIADFIESSPAGYQAMVGERGVRLSGGQRQRIGIARALYKRASVLVFDEATSALDTHTEQAVMDAINALGKELTIVIIAHRLTTIRRCDSILEIAAGRVAHEGTYDQLMSVSRAFELPDAAQR